MRMFTTKSQSKGLSFASGLTRRLGLAGALVLVGTLAACSGGSAATSGASSVAQPSSAQGSAAPSAAGSSSNAGNPADSCTVATKADVEAAFGGTSTVGKSGDYGVCTFDVSGALKAGNPGDSPLGLRVFFDKKYISYATIKPIQGDKVVQVDGVGTEAYYTAETGLLHVQVPGGMLTVGGTNFSALDKAALQGSMVALGKAIVAHL